MPRYHHSVGQPTMYEDFNNYCTAHIRSGQAIVDRWGAARRVDRELKPELIEASSYVFDDLRSGRGYRYRECGPGKTCRVCGWSDWIWRPRRNCWDCKECARRHCRNSRARRRAREAQNKRTLADVS